MKMPPRITFLALFVSIFWVETLAQTPEELKQQLMSSKNEVEKLEFRLKKQQFFDYYYCF